MYARSNKGELDFFFQSPLPQAFFVALPSKDMRLCIPLPLPKYSFLKKVVFFRDRGGEGELSRNLNDSPISLASV